MGGHLLLLVAWLPAGLGEPEKWLSTTIGGLAARVQCWGKDGVRVMLGHSQDTLEEVPATQALLPTPPSSPVSGCHWSNSSVASGNLQATMGVNGLEFHRVSDGQLLLGGMRQAFLRHSDSTSNEGYVSFRRQQGGGPEKDTPETLYGLGEHRTGSVRLPSTWFWNLSVSHDVHVSAGEDNFIPFLASRDLGWGMLWNLPSYGTFNLSTSRFTFSTVDAPSQLDFFVCTTPMPLTTSALVPIVNRYVDVTGHAPLLPTYATGFIQSKDRYRNASQLLEVATEHKVRRGLPLSLIVVDFHHWEALGDWALNKGGSHCWGDPAVLVSALRDLGVEVMVSVWPMVEPASGNFEAMTSQRLVVANDSQGTPLVGGEVGQDAALYDSFQPAARDFVWAQLLDHYRNYGIRSFWIDASEPQMKGLTPGIAHVRSEERQEDGGSGSGDSGWVPDTRVMEAWVVRHQQMIYEGLQATADQSRPTIAESGMEELPGFILSRGYWAGSQRFGAALWSGDVNSTWEELGLQIKVAQSSALLVPYWSTDIGGFKNGDPTDPSFRELIVRWFQFGVFCPLFRLHGHRLGGPPQDECGGTGGPNEVWSFGDTAYEIIKDLLLLRESLRPYVERHLRETSRTGLPLIRSMAMAFPLDPTSQTEAVEDQYMFGDEFLVAPVFMEQAPNRSVYLPPLEREVWEHYFTGQRHKGGRVITEPTPLETFPLYRRHASNESRNPSSS